MRSAEFVTARELYKEFLASPYHSEAADYLTLLRNVAEFVRAKKLGDAQSRSVLRKMAPLLRTEMESVVNELELDGGSRRIEYNKENPPPDLDLFRAFIKILYTARDPQLQDVVDRANQSFMKFYGKGLTLAKLRSIAASNPLNGALWKDAVGKWAQSH